MWHWALGRPLGFPDSSVAKESTCKAGDPSSIPGSGRYAGEGIGYPPQYCWASFVAQLVKILPATRETWVRSPGWEDPLEKGKASHFQYSGLMCPWGHKESDRTEPLSVSLTGLGRGLKSGDMYLSYKTVIRIAYDEEDKMPVQSKYLVYVNSSSSHVTDDGHTCTGSY